ncbi:hypothetical protein W97_00347 [Coniosporium apollinis CBS 100218]|uniref:Succinylglutamate desuccinylase/Aspartoacylase catalytic domain-containing protein n=1 Tax=Coniosporium apollinis (strain CBS 100218) TaxID=1168221 RepID=R7YHP0_CONA1|nr:uncharacterized protein W97_00347 [Coniosporium apollinis CBS 100218]EON61136.1 hypothetical protein W97_00347 [Coniosporium apollinis CBS 100218]
MKLSRQSLAAALVGLASAQTNFTGDVLQGAQVVSFLDLADVPSNAVTRYYLRVGELNGGLPLHLPVFVARGPPETLATGKKLSLSAAIHGDELNGVRVVQRVFEGLESVVGTLNGTVIGIPTVNPPGIYLNQRNYFTASSSGFLTNVNRVFPGVAPEDGASGPQLLAYNVWNGLWGNTSQVDVGIDLHTLSTGSNSSLWCYADFRLPYVERLAKLLQPNTIKIDPGEPGSIETTFVSAGIPSITVEMGAAKEWRVSLINRAVDFIGRVMEDLAILPASSASGGAAYVPDLSQTYIITTFEGLASNFGGFVEPLVGVDQHVTAGQQLANIRNVFGDVLQTVTAPVDARIHQIAVDPSTEPGERVVQLAYNSTDPECADGCVL